MSGVDSERYQDSGLGVVCDLRHCFIRNVLNLLNNKKNYLLFIKILLKRGLAISGQIFHCDIFYFIEYCSSGKLKQYTTCYMASLNTRF